MDLTVKQVRRNLRAGRFQLSGPKSHHKSTFTSNVWKTSFMKMVYEGEELVRSFYHCTECDVTMHVEQGPSGNSKLRRHKCFKNWLAANKPKPKPVPKESDSSDSEGEDNDGDDEGNSGEANVHTNILARVFNDFRTLCQKPECIRITTARDFERIIPKTFNENDW